MIYTLYFVIEFLKDLRPFCENMGQTKNIKQQLPNLFDWRFSFISMAD